MIPLPVLAALGAFAMLGRRRTRPTSQSGTSQVTPASDTEGQYNRNRGQRPHRAGRLRNCGRCMKAD